MLSAKTLNMLYSLVTSPNRETGSSEFGSSKQCSIYVNDGQSLIIRKEHILTSHILPAAHQTVRVLDCPEGFELTSGIFNYLRNVEVPYFLGLTLLTEFLEFFGDGGISDLYVF